MRVYQNTYCDFCSARLEHGTFPQYPILMEVSNTIKMACYHCARYLPEPTSSKHQELLDNSRFAIIAGGEVYPPTLRTFGTYNTFPQLVRALKAHQNLIGRIPFFFEEWQLALATCRPELFENDNRPTDEEIAEWLST